MPTPGPEAAARGLRWMNERSVGNCIACHSLPGHSGVQSNFGPALAGVATRYGPEQLRQWVTDARLLKANTLMPPFGSTEATHRATQSRPMLSPAEIEDVVAALQSLR